MRITLDKEKIYESVTMRISVIGRDITDANGNPMYDKVRILERDYHMLDSYRNIAVGEVSLSLRDFVVCKSSEEMSLYLDERVNPALTNDANSLIFEYIVNRICSEWMKIKWEPSAENFQNSADSALTTLSNLLYYRNSAFGTTEYERYRYQSKETGLKDGRKVYEVVLLAYSLLNDIEKELFQLYKTRKSIADALQPGAIELRNVLNVYINKHSKRITKRISSYILSYNCQQNDNAVVGPQMEYQYSLAMPCLWPSHHIEQLAEEMHGYIVASCLYDYLKGNFSGEALVYKESSEAAWDNMKHCVSSRKGGIRKPLQPF